MARKIILSRGENDFKLENAEYSQLVVELFGDDLEPSQKVEILEDLSKEDIEKGIIEFQKIVEFKKFIEKIKSGMESFDDLDKIQERIREGLLSCDFSHPLLSFLILNLSKEIKFLEFFNSNSKNGIEFSKYQFEGYVRNYNPLKDYNPPKVDKSKSKEKSKDKPPKSKLETKYRLVSEIDTYEDIIQCLMCDIIPQFGEFHFLFACRRGLLEVSKFIFEHFNLSRYMNPLMDMESETAILEQKYMEKYKFIYTDNIHHTYPMLLTYSYLEVVKSGNIELFDWIYETLTKYEVVNDEDMAFRSFVEACEYGNLDMVKHLMEKFPDININGITNKQFDFGLYFTPISLACFNGNLDVVEFLYETGKIENLRDCVLVMDYGSKRKCGIIDYKLKEKRGEVMNWIFSKIEDKRELYDYRYCMEHSFMIEYTKSAISELGKEVVLDVLMSRANAMKYMMTNYNFPEVKFTFEELFNDNEKYIEEAKLAVKNNPDKYQRYKKLFIGIKTVEDIEWLIRNELINVLDFKTLIKKWREGTDYDNDDYMDFLEFIKEVIVNCNLEVLRWVIHQFEPEDLDYIRTNGDYKYQKRTSILSQIKLTKNELVHLINHQRENIEYLYENELIGYEFFERNKEEDYIIYDYDEINLFIKSWNWMVKKDIICEGNYEDYKKNYFTLAPFVIYGFRDAPDYDDEDYGDDDDDDGYVNRYRYHPDGW
jgi:hypothetical protein